MYNIRRWFYKPKKDDGSILAQFYYADEELNNVAADLDSFDGRKDPERCTALVNQLRQCQDKVLTICNQIMDEIIPDERANRDFRVKFPDDVWQDNLAGQLWFGAECLAAGSSIMNREAESNSMRPLAKALTKTLDVIRCLLRDHALKNPPEMYSEKLKEMLKIFDRLFAEFELEYISTMIHVKSVDEYERQQDLVVLFSETAQRSIRLNLLKQETVDDCDPALMFTIPRLAIICGLLVYPEGPLNPEVEPNQMSEMFRPFIGLLIKIRDLLWTLSKSELYALEKALCDMEETVVFPNKEGGPTTQGQHTTQTRCDHPSSEKYPPLNDVDNYVDEFYKDNPTAMQFISEFYGGERTQDKVSDAERAQHEPSSSMASPSHSEFHECNTTIYDDSLDVAGSSPEGACYIAPQIASKLEPNFVVRSEGDCSRRNRVVMSNPEQPIRTKKGRKKAGKKGEVSPNRKRDSSSVKKGGGSKGIPVVGPLVSRLKEGGADGMSSSCSSCNSKTSADNNSIYSSSYGSVCQDDEEIALAIQAAEIANRNKVRAKFKSPQDLIHRLFVCVAGVADQLQTNFASDLRNILRNVYDINKTAEEDTDDLNTALLKKLQTEGISDDEDQLSGQNAFERNLQGLAADRSSDQPERVSIESAEEARELSDNSDGGADVDGNDPPEWIPDELAPSCMGCKSQFNMVRRRHHCRNCGKVFCAKCSSNSVPLPHYGHSKPVRVCNKCHVCYVTPFVLHRHQEQQQPQTV